MSKKILIGVSLVILLGCGLTLATAHGFWKQISDSARVSSLAQRVADFDLPHGYRSDYAVEILGYTIIAYCSDDEYSHLAFLQAPPGIIPDDQVLEGYIPNDRVTVRWNESTLLRTEQRTIRDHSATLTTSERTNSEGRRYRSLNMVFEGREGKVMLVINQPVSEWNDDQIEAFIASIH